MAILKSQPVLCCTRSPVFHAGGTVALGATTNCWPLGTTWKKLVGPGHLQWSCTLSRLRCEKSQGAPVKHMGTSSPGRCLSMSPLSFVCFHTGHLGCVVSLPRFFFWAWDVFQSSTFLAFISSLFSVTYPYLYGKHRHQDLPAAAVQILHFGGEGIQAEYVDFHILK